MQSQIGLTVWACTKTVIFYLCFIVRSTIIERKQNEREIKALRRMTSSEARMEEMKMMNIPTIDMVATGKNIVALRDAAGLTVRDLQDIFGFATPQAIYKWQHGTALPTIDNLVILAAIFDVAMDDIIVIDVDAAVQISA